jgi:hypothetical protein
MRPSGGIEQASFVAASYTPAVPRASHPEPPRREVLNAIHALREMPPAVREREINTGRYSHFSAEERKLLQSESR